MDEFLLQFANYEKSTRKLDKNTYECPIYYNIEMTYVAGGAVTRGEPPHFQT